MCTGKKIVALLCVAALTVSLPGCRKSPALVDEIYTEDASSVDPNHEAFESDEQGEEGSPLDNKEDEASEHKNGEADTAAVRNEQADDNGTSRDKDKSTNKNNDLLSGEGSDSDGIDPGKGKTPSEKENEIPPQQQIPETPPQQQIPETPPKQEEVPKKHVTNAYGEEQEIPEDVYTVTAVGDAAPIVAMVGGAVRLVGTSESFANNILGSMIRNSDTDAHMETWWTGDGSEPMSGDAFQSLLKAKPDLCFVVDGESTFSSDQLTQLQQNGISCFTIKQLSSAENMKWSVRAVAQVLEANQSTGENANIIAQKYCDWVDDTLSNVSKSRKELDYYSIYISEWRDNIRFQRRYKPGYIAGYAENELIVDFPAASGVVDGAGQGVAIASTDVNGKPIFELWKSAGVRNCATEYDIYGLISEAQYLGYKGMYIFPYMNEFGLPTFSDSSYYFPSDSVPEWYEDFRPYPFTWGLSTPDAILENSYDGINHLGGSERFPAIVVADEYVKSKISGSPQWKAGFLDGINNSANDIAGDYDIYVNPVGFCNWADGGVDSPLEAYWIQCKISGAISEDAMKTQVRNFYRDFYGITLSDAQINDIVNR